MKRLLLSLLLLSLSSIPAVAQNPTSKVIKRAGYVAGKRGDIFVNSSTGVTYMCKSASCTSGGSGWASMDASTVTGTTINATNNFLPKRQSATAFTDSLLSDDGQTVNLGSGFNGYGVVNLGRSVTAVPGPLAALEIFMTANPAADISNAIIGQQTSVNMEGTHNSTRDLIAHQMQSNANGTGAVRNIESLATFTYNAASPTVNFVTTLSSFNESDTGNVAEMHGWFHQNGIYGGTVNKAYGAKLVAADVSGGTVNENYGLWVGDHSTAGTTNFNIYSAGANSKNYFEGGVSMGGTITATGTTGAQTINKASGSVNFAAAASSLVVTNSKVTATSNVICTVQTDDATATSCKAIPAAGSFTLKLNAAATGETRVGFLVINQ